MKKQSKKESSKEASDKKDGFGYFKGVGRFTHDDEFRGQLDELDDSFY